MTYRRRLTIALGLSLLFLHHEPLLSEARALSSSGPSLPSITNQETNDVSLKDAIGVLTSNPGASGLHLRLFNDDGSLWYEFSFRDEDRQSKGFNEAAGRKFRPFAFHLDYFVVALKCVGSDEGRYKVVVNEDTRLTKFVSKSDPAWKFETWNEHLLTLFAVGFDPSSNPLRKAPAEKASGVNCPPNVVFHPVQVNGNWLKVRRDNEDQPTNKRTKTGYGWIRWRSNNKLMIEPFYIS